jgi:hypothetical protein
MALLVVTLALLVVHSPAAADDPLPSWTDGAAKRAIVDFVQHLCASKTLKPLLGLL